MAEPVTRENDGDVHAFLAQVENEERRRDCRAVMELMQAVTGEPPRLWGDSMIGFGRYHYVYASGREGDWFLTGVSPRKRNLSIHIMTGFEDHGDLMERLGKHRTGKSCLYLNRLSDVDVEVLEELVRRSVEAMRARYA